MLKQRHVLPGPEDVRLRQSFLKADSTVSIIDMPCTIQQHFLRDTI